MTDQLNAEVAALTQQVADIKASGVMGNALALTAAEERLATAQAKVAAKAQADAKAKALAAATPAPTPAPPVPETPEENSAWPNNPAPQNSGRNAPRASGLSEGETNVKS